MYIRPTTSDIHLARVALRGFIHARLAWLTAIFVLSNGHYNEPRGSIDAIKKLGATSLVAGSTHMCSWDVWSLFTVDHIPVALGVGG